MVRKSMFPFSPKYATHPGLVLSEELEARGMSQAELAKRTGHPPKVINLIIKGKAPITPETALQLEHVLGIPASVWNSLEAGYNESVARISERERLASSVHLLRSLPVRELVAYDLIDQIDDPVD